MTKQTKLTEKGRRIADTRKRKRDECIEEYLREVEGLNKEQARSHRFSMLVQELLGSQPGFIENYVSGIEKYIKYREKDLFLRGRADNLFGSLIIEFEANIPRKVAQAEKQLGDYVAIVWCNEPPDTRRPYLCIATDGVRFRTYSPSVRDPKARKVESKDVRLELVEEADWTKLRPEGVFYWLDRHFLRQEVLHPTSEAIVRDFGVDSHAFQTTKTALLAMWEKLKDEDPFAVIYANWEGYLRTVYGSDVAGDELFVRHTYLATVAKVMSWMRITERASLPDDAQIVEMLEGRLFKAQGIENFIEEDFFSWLTRPGAVNVGVATTRWLFSLLQNYNFRELSEDVLKSLYQQLVDPEMRHDLGEYYTPDWLAHRIVRRLLDDKPRGVLLDPACGSGTFLYMAIREKCAKLGRSLRTLRHILNSVYGVDVHPLAVIIAKTNYILALGDLLKKRKKPVGIPVYFADTLKVRPLEQQQTIVLVNGTPVPALPQQLLQDVFLYDRAIDLANDFAVANKDKSVTLEAFRDFLVAQRLPKARDKALAQGLFAITQTLKQFVDTDRDTIYAYILKNIYKPVFFRRKFDFVIGNPPWIAFRYLQPEYQEFLKWQITGVYKLIRERVELITHLEVGTFFLLRAADLYLKAGGRIAFVLPKSIFSADQHDGLRRGRFTLRESPGHRLSWKEIWDCESVEPLFNVPACVLLAEKTESGEGGQPMASPVPGRILSGKLERKNASLPEAEKALTVQDVKFSLHTRGNRSFWAVGKAPAARPPSPYKGRFAQGAAIVPRSFWFVQVKPSPVGFDPNLPPVETADHARKQAKAPYKDVSFRGNVESPFLYATLLSADLLPFGHLDYRLVVLPIEPKADHYKLIHADEASRRGFLYLARWLEKAQAQWKRYRGSKAKRITALGWLDYRRKLTLQNPRATYRVVYNTSGTFLAGAVLEKKLIAFNIGGQLVTARGFIADTKTYFFESNHPNESFFLVGVLNAPIVDHLLKPMQSRGLWGPRDIHKKILDLPIPQFDPGHADHCRLAQLGEECTGKVNRWLKKGGPGTTKSIGKLRAMVREILREELTEIDELAKRLLGVAE